MLVGLGPGHIVLDWDPAPLSQRGTAHPIFGPYLLQPNGCMDQDRLVNEAMSCRGQGRGRGHRARGRGQNPNEAKAEASCHEAEAQSEARFSGLEAEAFSMT